MKIFLAAPLFSEAERCFNQSVAERLRREGFEVWMAQEEQSIHVGSCEEMKEIYERDIQALVESDIVVCILDGVDVDSGTAFEVGFAVARDKPIFGLKTDYRTFSSKESVNLMLEVPLIKICRNIGELVNEIKTFELKGRVKE